MRHGNAALLAEANARGMTVHMGATVYTARRDAEVSRCAVSISIASMRRAKWVS